MDFGSSARWISVGLALVLASCSGSSGGGTNATITVSAVVQDLVVDPDGTTTVLTFSSPLATALPANFVANGGQTPLTATISGNDVTVTWDARVTPSHQVRVTGKSAVASGFNAVTTTNTAQPTFSYVSNAAQNAGLGGDVITVQFAGPRVVESQAENLANWTLTVNGQTMDLAGSTLDLVPATQVMTITTGPGANLHSTFTLAPVSVASVADVAMATAGVAGTATGDSVDPTLVSVEQNLAEDEFGRVVDVTFSEAMDPVFAVNLANFSVTNPDVAIQAVQPTGQPEVLRVTFNNPIVPGKDTITLQNLIDVHGRPYATSVEAVAAGSTVANGFATTPALVTVANSGGDTLTIEFTQALDPDEVATSDRWILESPPGNVIDLSTSTFTYDFLNKTLLIELTDDLLTADTFDLEPDPGMLPLDVDGQTFTATALAVAITGDVALPVVSSVVQNRSVDSSGTTIDVTFAEDVEQTTAETLTNWDIGGSNPTTATRMPGLDLVRLVFASPILPGDDTIDVSNVTDLAGNAMAAASAVAVTSTDVTQPNPTAATATAVEGADDDTLVVTFDDNMYAPEVTDPDNWNIESPVGTPLDESAATITYDAGSRTATLTFGAGTNIDLKRGDDFSVVFDTMRDLGGNVVSTNSVAGTITAESNLPTLVSAWVETTFANEVHLRFSEPVAFTDDITGLTSYEVRDVSDTLKGAPTSATVDPDRMGVELVFGFGIVAGSDVISMSGITDLAGNHMFPVTSTTIAAEDANELAIDGVSSAVTTVSGERNDTITVVFDRSASPWGLLDPANWDVEQGGSPVDLSGAHFAFDGDKTVTISFSASGSPSLTTGLSYDLSVDNVETAQGVALTAAATDSLTAAGDALAPTLPAGKARLDAANPTTAVLIELDEAIDPADAVNTALIDINGTTFPDTAELLGLRTVRATFSGGVTTADTVNVTFDDLAGNNAVLSRAITAQDAAGPLPLSVAGVSVPDSGLDYVTVAFNKPVDLSGALASTNYSITNGTNPMSLVGSSFRYESATNTVTIVLAAGQELDPTLSLGVDISNVTDHAGLTMIPASIGGAVTGDTTGASFTAGFANYREDGTGAVVDVAFDEDVDTAFVGNVLNWSSTGAQNVLSVQALSGKLFRLTLTGALAGGDQLELVDVPDLAGNLSGSISVTPTL